MKAGEFERHSQCSLCTIALPRGASDLREEMRCVSQHPWKCEVLELTVGDRTEAFLQLLFPVVTRTVKGWEAGGQAQRTPALTCQHCQQLPGLPP